MTTALRIAPGLNLPVDAVTEPVGVFGNRGAGKTNTAVVFVEELLDAGQQAAIIDPTDVWWGLKSSKDGKSAGYPVVVLGGRHADAPLGAEDGKTVADFVVDEGATVVLSTRHFESHADGIRFVTSFLRRLYYRKGQVDTPTPLTIVVDEAHLWFPQMRGPGGGPALDCIGAGQAIVRQGRSSGLGIWIIDQRTASVSKDLIDLVEVLVAHRITGPKNRAALKDWIEQNASTEQRKAFLDTLATQPDGTAQVELLTGQTERVVSMVASLADEMDEALIEVSATSQLDTEVTSHFAGGVPSRILPARPVAAHATPIHPNGASAKSNGVTGVEQRILNTLRGLEDLGISPVDKPTAAALVGYHPNAKSYSNALGSLRSAGKIEYPGNATIALTAGGRAIAESSLPVRTRRELHETWFSKLGNVARKILGPVISEYPHPVPADLLAEAAGYHPNAKSFSNMKGRLRTLGLIDYPSQGMVVATPILFPKGLR